MSWVEIIEYTLLPIFASANFIYLWISINGFYNIFRHQKEVEANNLHLLLSDEEMPKISILIPGYNESSSVAFSVQCLLNLSYRNKEIIFIDDGSTDETLSVIKHQFKLFRVHLPTEGKIATEPVKACYKSLLYENLTVITKQNGRKADAVNAGINVSSSDFTIIMDSDTLIDSHELNRLIRYFLLHPEIGAFGGTVRVANNCTVKLSGITEVHLPRNYLAGIQTVEYLRAFLIGRAGWNFARGALIMSGAFTVMRTDLLKELGGYDHKMIGEDMELTVRYKRTQIAKGRPYYTGFIPQPVSWTEVPEVRKILGKQRTRWQIGLIQVLWKHRGLFFNPKYKFLGLLLIPYFVFLELLAPIFELVGYGVIVYVLFYGVHGAAFTFLFLGLSWGVTAFVNLFAITMERFAFNKYATTKEFLLLSLYCLLENIGYRQMTIWWRLRAFGRLFSGRLGWDVVAKKGFFKKH